MKPKEYAEELVNEMYGKTPVRENESLRKQDWHVSKEHAIIAVDKILKTYNAHWVKLDFWTEEINSTIEYFEQVKKEIELL